MVWVVPLSAPDLSTRCLTPGKHVVAFGVCQGSVGLRPLALTVALPLRHSIPRLPLKAFRRERAISRLD